MLRRTALAVVLATALAGAPAAPALAEPAQATAANRYYYTVDGKKDLWEVAAAFLGDAGRAGEIYALNAGRVQPDGGRLADPAELAEGWVLALPFDAAGSGLEYGPLPAGAEPEAACDWKTGITPDPAWQCPAQAWATADGSGVTVAVVGSGVDGTAPGLTGRVLAGTDLGPGGGRGDTACKGTGTALAGIVAGDDEAYGIAPAARILPVRTTAERVADAIRVASAGAGVVLVGADVNAADPAVRTALNDALARDAVVVLPVTAGATAAEGLLRVGSAGDDPGDGEFDVLAPGEKVKSVGGTRSGPAFAAAYAAGTAALVRSAQPQLSAAQVARRVRETAASGVVSPVGAVAPAQPGAAAEAVAPQDNGWVLDLLGQMLLWVGMLGIAAVLVAVLLQLPAFRRHSS